MIAIFFFESDYVEGFGIVQYFIVQSNLSCTTKVKLTDSLTAPNTGILALGLEAHDPHTHVFSL